MPATQITDVTIICSCDYISEQKNKTRHTFLDQPPLYSSPISRNLTVVLGLFWQMFFVADVILNIKWNWTNVEEGYGEGAAVRCRRTQPQSPGGSVESACCATPPSNWSFSSSASYDSVLPTFDSAEWDLSSHRDQNRPSH